MSAARHHYFYLDVCICTSEMQIYKGMMGTFPEMSFKLRSI